LVHPDVNENQIYDLELPLQQYYSSINVYKPPIPPTIQRHVFVTKNKSSSPHVLMVGNIIVEVLNNIGSIYDFIALIKSCSVMYTII
jgi:hypothetical protein